MALSANTTLQYTVRTALAGFGVFVILASSGGQRKYDSVIGSGESFSDLTLVTEGTAACSHPEAGPGGAPLLFVSKKDGNNDLFLKRNPTSAAIQKLTTHGANDTTPCFSPDGAQIAFASTRSGNSDIFIMSSKGAAAKRQLTDTPEIELWPTWSPDGTTIAYAKFSLYDYKWYIWTKSLVTNAVVQVGPGRDPSFSPNGKKIMFEKATSGGDQWYSLWTMNLDGTEITQITSGSEWGAVDSAWSPDGKKIVFKSSKGISAKVYQERIEDADDRDEYIETISRTASDGNLWIINDDGSGLTQLTTHEAADGQPMWSQDNYLYFISDRDNKYRVWRFTPRFSDGYVPERQERAEIPCLHRLTTVFP